MDWHNIESVLMRRYAQRVGSFVHRWAARRTAYLLERLELSLLESCDAHIVVSEADRKRLQARTASARICCIPNGVDAAWYEAVLPQDHPAAELRRRTDLLLVGSMDYFPNVDAACWFRREIWPAIERNSPALRLVVVGRDPHPRVIALQSDRVRITGTVDDVRPFYQEAVAAVVPLRTGAGSRLKIPEAMAAGVPVISTRLGAEGLDLVPEEHFLAAETPEEFAAAVHRLLASPQLWQRLSETGRRLARDRFDWRRMGRKLYELHLEVQRLRACRS
jgi:glycosyltransferase involved in cell wall biosynthesis